MTCILSDSNDSVVTCQLMLASIQLFRSARVPNALLCSRRALARHEHSPHLVKFCTSYGNRESIGDIHRSMPHFRQAVSTYIFSFVPAGSIRSSTKRMSLMVCSASVRVRIYSMVSNSSLVLSSCAIIPYVAEYAPDGQSSPCTERKYPLS